MSLALGIGANTAIFSIIDKLLLESLPVERPRELVLLNPMGLRNGWTAGGQTWSYPAYRGLREHQQVFAGLIAERTDAVNLTVDGTTLRAVASIVSGNYFEVLGVHALAGRLLSDADDRSGAAIPPSCSATASGSSVSAAAPTSSVRRSAWAAIRSRSSASARRASTDWRSVDRSTSSCRR